MSTIEKVKEDLKQFNSHNEEQKITRRLNDPLIAQCKTWVEAMAKKENMDETCHAIITAVNNFVETGEGLLDVKRLVEETMVGLSKSKMEELNAYKR